MAIQIRPNGQWSAEYEGPYKGLDTQNPETLISDKASPSFNNFMLRNAEIRSRPALTNLFFSPGPYPLGVSSFIDINGTTHIVMWSSSNLWQYDPTGLPTNPWTLVGGIGAGAPGDMQTNPVSYRSFASAIYYTNIAILGHRGKPIRPSILPFMGYWTGITAAPVISTTFADTSTALSAAGVSKTNSPTVGGSLPGAPTVVGPLAIGGGFLGELNNYLLLANVSVRDQNNGLIYNFPNLLWWSANGIPTIWDPTQNTSAGFNPFLDVPDIITGMATMGVAGYLFRTNGITQFSPTGSSAAPFTFDHMWASDHGIGNVFPWSIAQYGPNVAFISTDNIYTLSITNSQPIGGGARDAIFADLAQAAFTPFAAIIPHFVFGKFVYLTYELFIPVNGLIRNWVYSFEEQNWAPWDLGILGDPNYPAMTCAPNVV